MQGGRLEQRRHAEQVVALAAVEQVHAATRIVGHGAQVGHDTAPDPGCRPAWQTTPSGTPVHQFKRQVTPGRAGARQPKHGFKKTPVIEGWPPGFGLLRRQHR
jgi:hypothetical protein